MMSSEDALPKHYKYAWTEHSEIDLNKFLTKFKPSMVQNDGSKPWIWVHGSDPATKDTGVEEATEEAIELLNAVTDKVETIKNDDSIPVRSNKKTGAKSKKELREQVQAEAGEKLKEISVRHGFVSGKWLIFAPADKVDTIWSGIATSLVSGPLHSTPAYLAKVSTSSETEIAQQHLICVYVPNVYDMSALSQVMKILLQNHGVNLSGVKSDLYTIIGLDSKHPSGVPPTVWRNAAILPEKEIKELKDAYFTQLASGSTKPAAADIEGTIPGTSAGGSKRPEAVTKQKAKLKRKAQDDPFASDDEEMKDTNTKKEVPVAQKAPVKVTKKVESDAEEAVKSTTTAKSSRSRGAAKRAQKQDVDEDDEDERPRKKKSVGK